MSNDRSAPTGAERKDILKVGPRNRGLTPVS